MFSVFFEFFDKGIFTDVKLYGGHGKKFIRCHAIILVSAIPGMKEVLGQVSDHEEEGITILLPEDSFESIKSTISDIYLAAKKVCHLKKSFMIFISNFYTSGCVFRRSQYQICVLRGGRDCSA